MENHREELTYYLHFSNSEREPPCGNAYYDQIGKMCRPFSPFWITFKIHKNSPKKLSMVKAIIAFKATILIIHAHKVNKMRDKHSQNRYVTNFTLYLWLESNHACLYGLKFDEVMRISLPFLHKKRHFILIIFPQAPIRWNTDLPKTHMLVELFVRELPPHAKNKFCW